VFIRAINTKFDKKKISTMKTEGPTDPRDETNRHVAIVKIANKIVQGKWRLLQLM
jgi:hypothetical protein